MNRQNRSVTKKKPAKGRPTPFVFSDREVGSIQIPNTGQGIEVAMKEAGRIKKQRLQDAAEAPAREAAAAEQAVADRDRLAQQLQQARGEKAALEATLAALTERVSALESITPNTEKAAATAAQTALLIDRQYQLSDQLQAQQVAVTATADEVRELAATATTQAAAAEASREQTLEVAKTSQTLMNGTVSSTSANYDRLQEQINESSAKISAAVQVLMDNAETIANLNRFEETIQQTMADMRESITSEVVAQSEESISEQMSVLAGAIGLRQEDLDRYENELRAGASLTLPVITENQIQAFRAYAKGANDRRSDA